MTSLTADEPLSNLILIVWVGYPFYSFKIEMFVKKKSRYLYKKMKDVVNERL